MQKVSIPGFIRKAFASGLENFFCVMSFLTYLTIIPNQIKNFSVQLEFFIPDTKKEKGADDTKQC